MNVCVFDGHCDTAFELWNRGCGLEKNNCHIDLEKTSGLTCYAQIFGFCSYAGQNLGAPCAQEEFLRLPLAKLRHEVAALPARVGFAQTAAQVQTLWQNGKRAILLSVEGPEVIGCAPDRVFHLREAGFCMTTLTWNQDNALAGSHGSDTGLTGRGRDFCRCAEEAGLLVDVSHLSDRGFWDIVSLACRPIVASHSNCRALQPVSRNLTDDQIRAISDLGGTVGLNLYAPFLGETADFSRMQEHLEHIMDIGGESCAALGGDLDGCDRLPMGMADARGYETFYGYLKGKGYGQSLLEKIFFRNLLRLF